MISTDRHHLTRVLRTAAVVVALLLIWQIADWAGLLPSVVPNVLDVAVGIVQVVLTGTFWSALLSTLAPALIGWVIASVLGVVIGMAIGVSGIMRRSTAFLLDFGRSFPFMALIPVFILLLGTNATMKVIVIVLTCFWPVVVQAAQGARRMDATASDMVQSYRIPFFLAFRRVRFPSALPFIATGVRIAASIAILIAVAVEVLSQTPGLGRQITSYQFVNQWDLAFAYLFFAGLCGWLIASLLLRIEKRMLRWNRRATDG